MGDSAGKYASHFPRVCFVCLQKTYIFPFGPGFLFCTYLLELEHWIINQHSSSFPQDLPSLQIHISISFAAMTLHIFTQNSHCRCRTFKRTEPKRISWLHRMDVFTYIRMSMYLDVCVGGLCHCHIATCLQPHLHSDAMGSPLHPSKIFEGSFPESHQPHTHTQFHDISCMLFFCCSYK